MQTDFEIPPAVAIEELAAEVAFWRRRAMAYATLAQAQRAKIEALETKADAQDVQ